MPSINLTLPVAGTNIAAGLHATNYAALQTLLNGGLDNANIATGAAIAVAKIAPGTNGQVLQTTAGATAWGDGTTIYRKTTEKDVVSTASETDLLNGEITIGAGVMSTNKTARVTLIGDYLNNSGANRTIQLKIKLGATTLFDDTTQNLTAAANRTPFKIVFDIANLGSASSQFMAGTLHIGENGFAATAGIGALDQNVSISGIYSHPIGGSATEDTATSKTLVVTVTHSASHASLSMRLKYAIIEII